MSALTGVMRVDIVEVWRRAQPKTFLEYIECFLFLQRLGREKSPDAGRDPLSVLDEPPTGVLQVRV